MSAIPQHVAIVMDGNGRWAKRRGHTRVFGHVRGASRVRAIVTEAGQLGIKALTLYAFSTENWSRPPAELSVLWKLLTRYLLAERDNLLRENVRLTILGELERLDPELQKIVHESVRMLKGCTGLRLNFAVSYGSRRELCRAARMFGEDVARGLRRPEEMNEKLLESYLWTSELGELAQVDLVIRTSGELRTSNYLLWQAAYAEYYFTELCWPDFGPRQLREAVTNFQSRERRFGAVGVKV